MSCNLKTSRASVRSALIKKKVIDQYNNILDFPKFRELNGLYSRDAQDRYGIKGSLMYDENNKVLFNDGSFRLIDAKKGINYPENKVEQELIKEYQYSPISDKVISPDLKSTLIAFCKKVNPDFRIETISNLNDGNGLSVNGLLKLNEFLIQVKSDNALPEEVAHILVEMLDKDSALFKELDNLIPYTKMYSRVVSEYGNKKGYKGNYPKLRREAIAKLVSLYMYDKELANKLIGSKDLVSKVIVWLKRLVSHFKGMKNPFEQSAIRILELNTKEMLYENALQSETMLQISSYDDFNVFQTLGHSPAEFEKVLININGSLFDTDSFSFENRGDLTGKQIKNRMWADPESLDLAKYYSSVNLTKLGRELRDKIRMADPYRNKFTLFTDAPITPELLNRLQEEFGDIKVVRTSGSVELGQTEDGEVIMGDVNKAEKIKEMIGGRNALVVDNSRATLKSLGNAEVEMVYYNNKRAKYVDYQEKINRDALAEKEILFNEAIVNEFNKLDPSNIVGIAKPALNLVRAIVNRVEKGDSFEEISELFKDEFGNMTVPQDRARQIIKQLESDSKEFSQGLISFMNTIGSTTLFWKNANKVDYRQLRELAKGDKDQVNRAIKDSAALMRMILQWEEWLNSIRPILASPEFEETSVIKAKFLELSGALEIAKDRINHIAVDVLSKQLSDTWKDYNAGKLAAFRVGQITEAQYLSEIVTPQKIANIIYGKEGDLSMTAYFENSLFIGNDLIQAVGTMVEKSIIGANVRSMNKSMALGNRLWKLEEELGMNSREVGEKIRYLDKKNVFEDGKMVQKDVWTLLNPWKNRWEKRAKTQEIEDKKKELFEARELGLDTKVLEEEYDKLYKDFKGWERDNWNRDMQTEPWEIYQHFGLVGPDFDRAMEIQQELWGQKKALMAELRTIPDSANQANKQKEIEQLEKRIKNLRNTYDVLNDKVKEESSDPEMDIRIAKILKEKHLIDVQLYEYKEDKPRFLKDLKSKILDIPDAGIQSTLLGLMDTKEETWLKEFYKVAEVIAPYSLMDWLDNNIKMQYSKDFYSSRQDIINELKESIDSLAEYASNKSQITDLNEKLKDSWNEIFNLSSSLRDENGVFDASDATLEHQKLIKDAEVEINDLKDLVKMAKIIDYDSLDSQDKLRIKSLKEKVKFLLEELANLQSKDPTDYYHDTMYEKLKDIYPKELGRVFSGENYLQLIDTPEFSKWLREEAPDDFKEWFKANHFMFEYESENINEVGEYELSVSYKPTYIWMKITPSNDKHVLMVPSYKYSDREYKDNVVVEYRDKNQFFQLKTEKNKDTWDEVLREWLPKSKAYRNEEYFEAIKNPKIKEYLEAVTDHYLSAQIDAPRDTRLGYTLPFMHKTFADGGGLNSLWREFSNKANAIEEGEQNAPEVGVESTKKTMRQRMADKLRGFIGLEVPEQKVVQTDLLGNKIQKIHTPYSTYISQELVTSDIAVSVLNYGESLERTKALVNNVPELNLLEQLLEQFSPFEADTINTKGQKVKAGSKRMLEIIQNIKKTKLYADTKEFELGEAVDLQTMRLRKYTTFFSQSVINPANSMKNWIQGQLNNLMLGVGNGWATDESIMKAIKSGKTSFVKFASEIGKKDKSLDFQLIALFNLSLERNISQLFSSSGSARQFKDLNKMVYTGSEATEFSVISTLLYSHLFNKQITINGEKKDLYDVFYLKEGKISLKENAYDNGRLIDEDYLTDLILKAKVITEHVQAKQASNKIADRFTLWSNFEFFKKYFIPSIRTRFVLKRKNLNMAVDIEGFYITTFKRFLLEVISYLDTGRFSGVALSPMEKNARRLMTRELLVMIATYLLITYLFGYDDDDKDRFKKLKDNSWATNFALMVMLNAKKETDSASIIPLFNIQENIIPPLFNETYNYVKEPFMGFGAWEQGKKLVDASFNHLLDNNAYYDKNIPQSFIEKGDSKLGHQIEKLIHWDAILGLIEPNYKIQSSQSFNR